MRRNPTYGYCSTAITLPINNRTLNYSNAVKSTHFVINILIATHKVFNSITSFGCKAIEIAICRAFSGLRWSNIGFRGIIKVNRNVRLYYAKLNQTLVVYVSMIAALAVRINDRGNCKIELIQAVMVNRHKVKHFRDGKRVFTFKAFSNGFKLRDKKNTVCYFDGIVLFHLVFILLASKVGKITTGW